MKLSLALVALILLCPVASLVAAPEKFGRPDATLYVSAQEIDRWQQDGATALHLKRDVRIYQGDDSITAPEALAWFQEGANGGAGVLTVYVESGKVAAKGTARNVTKPLMCQSGPARGLVLNGLIAAAGDAPGEAAFVTNALAFRSGQPVPKPAKSSGRALELLRPAAEEVSVVEMPDETAVITLRGNAQVAGDNMTVKADTIRARVDKAAAEGQDNKDRPPLRSLYAEGTVEFQRDGQRVLADSLYMDVPNQTGLALNARVRGHTGVMSLPIQFHADSVRQMSNYRFVLEGGGYFSTSAFAKPHYRIQGTEIEAVRGPRNPDAGPDQAKESVVVASHNNWLYVGPIPVLYWPYIAKDVNSGAFLITSAELGTSGDLGTYVRLSWNLYDLVYASSKTTSLSLLTDYYAGRGPGFGLDFQYHTPERHGWARAYYVHDRSDFDATAIPTPKVDRGEFTLRDRELLSEHLRLDTEIGYLSDRRFLRTYDLEHLDTDKDRETGMFLRYMDDNWMTNVLARERINNFQNSVDREGVSYHAFAGQLWDTQLLWTTHTDVSRLRLRTDTDLPIDRFSNVVRFDSANELSLPFMVGPVRLAPYLWEDATAYTRTAEDNDNTMRWASAAGFRAGAGFYRTFDARNELLGVDGLRHILTPTVDFRDIYNVTRRSTEFIQHDEIDAIDEATQVTAGLHNRLQTHRFINGQRSLTDFLTADLEYTELVRNRFPNDPQDSHADLSLAWQATDNIRFASEDNRYNTEERRLEAGNAELTLSYWKPVTVGLMYKYYLDFQDKDLPKHSVASINLSYQPPYSRWKVDFQTSYDFENNPGRKAHKLGTGLFFTRQLEDWAVRFGVRLNSGISNETVLSFNVIPPGSRRYEHPYNTTGLYYY